MDRINLENLIDKIQHEFPEFMTPEMLLKIGLGGSHAQLFRIRQNGIIPFVKLSNARIMYLKADVIDWLRDQYQSSDKKKTPSKCTQKQHAGLRSEK